VEERDPATQALATVALQRAAWPEISLAFEEPASSGRSAARWPVLLVLGLAIAGSRAVVVRNARAGELGRVVESTRATATLAAELAASPAEALARPAVVAHAVPCWVIGRRGPGEPGSARMPSRSGPRRSTRWRRRSARADSKPRPADPRYSVSRSERSISATPQACA
jgi:hypothetical protein